MIGKKQDQKVESEGTAIQAGGSVHITQYLSLSSDQIEEIIRVTYPSLQEEARRVALENSEKFARKLEKKLIDSAENIVLDKFADPDVQGCIRDAVLGCARHGDKANTETLLGLIVKRASNSSTEFLDLVISEAISIVPKLTRAQICHLSFIHFLQNTSINNLQRLEDLEPWAQKVLPSVKDGIDLSSAQRLHMEYAGVCSIAEFMKMNIYEGWMKIYGENLGYTDVEKFKKDVGEASPTLNFLLKTYDNRWSSGEVKLTSVGHSIAIANLSTSMGKLDYSIWLN